MNITCRTTASSAIRARSPAAAAAVDPMPTAKSFNVPSTLDGNIAESGVADKDVAKDDALEVFSLKQVSDNESWMVIYDKVYDLTDFFSEVNCKINSVNKSIVDLPCSLLSMS